MAMIQLILATLVTIVLVVSIHEYGHFWVARRCGVKVLRFSVGFGKPLWRWFDKHGTEFAIASIPLGGYVKMLDEREGNVPEHELTRSFNRKPVLQRMAIVVAGPAANFLLAILVYWLYFLVGTTALKPVIGPLADGTAAASAGLPEQQEIVAVDGVPTPSWQDVSIQLLARMGETGDLVFETQSLDGLQQQQTRIGVSKWLADSEQPDPLAALGIEPYIPSVPARIGVIVPKGPAAMAGIMEQDLVLALDGRAVESWQQMVALVQERPNQEVELLIERDGRRFNLKVLASQQQSEAGVMTGFLGIGAANVDWPPELLREIRYSVIGAWPQAFKRTWDMTALTAVSLKKMLMGQISVKNLSGPITIAKVAGSAVERGLIYYLNFLAYLSISLGFINILPIPVLDGGHLMYYLAELVRGKPVSEQVQMVGLRIGLAIIASLMFLALYYDLMRL